jgi:flagellar biosynthesis/type III secretory pathway protein FliH
MFEGAGRSLWKEGRQEGLQEGIQQGRREGIQEGVQQGKESTLLENIQSLVEQLHLSPEQAMDALKVPAQDRGRIREKLLPSS